MSEQAPLPNSFDEMPNDALLSMKEIASLFGVARHVVQRMALKGDLPVVLADGEMKVTRGALEAYVRGNPSAVDERLLMQFTHALDVVTKRLDTVIAQLDSIDRGIKGVVEYQSRRSGKRAGLKPAMREAILKRDGLNCRYCGKGVPLEGAFIDHVRPVAMGGATHPDNLVVSCIKCNRRKAHYTLDEVGMTLLPVPEDEFDIALSRRYGRLDAAMKHTQKGLERSALSDPRRDQGTHH